MAGMQDHGSAGDPLVLSFGNSYAHVTRAGDGRDVEFEIFSAEDWNRGKEGEFINDPITFKVVQWQLLLLAGFLIGAQAGDVDV